MVAGERELTIFQFKSLCLSFESSNWCHVPKSASQFAGFSELHPDACIRESESYHYSYNQAVPRDEIL